MKLNTSKYKLTIYTETTCPGCAELKNSLKDMAIPFSEKDITKDTTKSTGPSVDNRWEFIDITREYEGTMLVPLISVEDIDGNTIHHSAGYDFDDTEEFIELLKTYCI
jgi:glutaredoxin